VIYTKSHTCLYLCYLCAWSSTHTRTVCKR